MLYTLYYINDIHSHEILKFRCVKQGFPHAPRSAPGEPSDQQPSLDRPPAGQR